MILLLIALFRTAPCWPNAGSLGRMYDSTRGQERAYLISDLAISDLAISDLAMGLQGVVLNEGP